MPSKGSKAHIDINFQARTRICEEALSEIRVFESQEGHLWTSNPPQNRTEYARNGPYDIRTLAQKAELIDLQATSKRKNEIDED